MVRRALILGVVMASVLSACNFGGEKEPPRPTLGTPIAWVTATLSPTPTPTAPPSATSTPTASPSATTPPTITPLPTLTLAPTLTPWSTVPPTITPAATATRTPFALFTATWTQTPAAPPLPSPTATRTGPPPVYSQPPTFTPVVYLTNTPPPTLPPTVQPPTAPPSAQVCATCDGLRLRKTPGTMGEIITELAAGTPLTIIGRTADSAWVQVVTREGQDGWVATEYLDVHIDLGVVSVTGEAVDATPAPGGALVSGGIISGVSSHARQILLDGLAKGNLPHSFTKVGDSITAAPHFLVPIGQGNYSLGEYGYLGSAIGFFSGPNGRGFNPFSASSLAAHNGWSTESVLNPANADPNICRAGETPLACEYRLTRPSVALIMFGTNDSGGMPSATFQANLQTIVQTSITMGVIPVLSTIPPKHYNPATDGRVFEFNQIIVATARAYDIPLIDYYQAMVGLPNQGLSPDGVHPSPAFDGLNAVFDAQHLQYGYPMRNFVSLQMLYTLWQQVLYDADSLTPSNPPPAPPAQPAEPNVPADGCAGAPSPRLAVGRRGRVTPGLPNKMRSAPSTGAPQVGSIPGEGVFNVVGGPQCADGYLWWQVDYEGVTGWTANGAGSEYWVEPAP